MRNRRGSPRGGATLVLVSAAVILPLLLAFHWGQQGWRDRHYNYPSRPDGYTQIVNRFGQPCSSQARAISMSWQAADTGKTFSLVPQEARRLPDGDDPQQGRNLDQPR